MLRADGPDTFASFLSPCEATFISGSHPNNIKSRFILQIKAARLLSHFSLPVVIYAETDLLPSETIRPGDPHGR